MPLILAIEPDRRQAAQLTSMVKGKLQAELVLAESAERGLAALGNRVPDLILTSALLSPKDESELGDRLRSLDGAAGHVQTLTIPVLATPKPLAQTTRSILSALRKGKARSGVPDGCDPAVFAEQCAAYLERAAAELASLRPVNPVIPVLNDEIIGPVDRLEPPGAEDLELNIVTSQATAAPFELDPVYVPVESLAQLIPQTADEPVSIFDREPVSQAVEAPLPVVKEEEEKREENEESQKSEESIEVYELGDIGQEPLVTTGALQSEDIVTSPPAVVRVPPPVPSIHLWPAMEGIGGVATPIEGIVEAISAAEADFAAQLTASIERAASHDLLDDLTLCEEEPLPNGQQARSDWVDVLEVLKRDVEQLRTDRSPSAAASSDGEPLGFAEGTVVADSGEASRNLPPDRDAPGGKQRRRSKDAPVQDEWGFFDPNRCGFAALLAKLEEITEDSENHPDGPRARRPA